MLVVGLQAAELWVDGRYWEQARQWLVERTAPVAETVRTLLEQENR